MVLEDILRLLVISRRNIARWSYLRHRFRPFELCKAEENVQSATFPAHHCDLPGLTTAAAQSAQYALLQPSNAHHKASLLEYIMRKHHKSYTFLFVQ